MEPKLQKPAKFLGNPWTHCFVLLLLVTFCFGETLGSYFLADDFLQVSYAAKALNDEPHLLVENFTGNYMQLPSMNVYRPMFLVSLMLDYSIWQAQPFGFYLSNLLYYAGCVLLVYLVTLEIVRNSPGSNGFQPAPTAFGAAALFAVNPLHCESVSWVVGRVDTVCAFFYLAALYMVLRACKPRAWLWWAPATAAFVVAILTKEMALGLPIILLAYGYLLAEGKPAGSRRSQDCWRSVSYGGWFLAIAVVYLIARAVFLGTIFGGYEDGLGAYVHQTAASRWSDLETVKRLFMPINEYVFGGTSAVVSEVFTVAYILLGVLIARQIAHRKISGSFALFSFIWLATCIGPILKLWGLAGNLEGARFYFFATIPLSLGIAVLIRRAAPALIAILMVVCYLTNHHWVVVSQNVRALCESAAAMAVQVPQGKRIALLDLPKDVGGVHTFYNGEMFRAAMNKPFQGENLAYRFITFEPFLVSPAGYINGQRFKNTIEQPDVAGPFVWDAADEQWRAVSYGHAGINPLKVDFVRGCALSAKDSDARLTANWATGTRNNSKPSAIFVLQHPIAQQTIHLTPNRCEPFSIRLSRYVDWYTRGDIKDVKVTSEQSGVEIRDIQLLPGEEIMPSIAMTGVIPDAAGVCVINESTFPMTVDASKIPNANSVQVQITKPNHLFDNFLGEQDSIIAMTIEVPNPKGSALLSPYLFSKAAYYQVRAKALSAAHTPLGDFSDPLTIYFTGAGTKE